MAGTCQIRAAVAAWLATTMANLFTADKGTIMPMTRIMIRILLDYFAAIYVGQELPLSNTSAVHKVILARAISKICISYTFCTISVEKAEV